MTQVALALVSLAAIAVVALVVRLFILLRRVQQVWERIDRTVESELAPGIHAWGDAAQGVQQAARNLDTGLSALNRVLERMDRVSARFESGALVGSAVGKLNSWLAGVRRGLSRPHEHRHVRVRDEGEPED